MKQFFLLSTVIFVGLPLRNEAKAEVLPDGGRRDQLEKQAISAYRAACQKLQDLADWKSIVLRMKSLWSRSMSKKAQSRLMPNTAGKLQGLDPIEKGSVAVQESTTNAGKQSSELSCASLKNLHVSAQTYILWQTQLMTAKTMVGANHLKSGLSRLNESIDGLKNVRNQIQQLAVVNRTSSLLLQNLKLGSQGLSLQLDNERNETLNLIKNIGRSSDFLQYLNAAKGTLQEHVQSLFETSESLKKAQNFLHIGDLLQNFGKVLDKTLLQVSPTATNTNEFNATMKHRIE